jgi:hypothetical protein
VSTFYCFPVLLSTNSGCLLPLATSSRYHSILFPHLSPAFHDIPTCSTPTLLSSSTPTDILNIHRRPKRPPLSSASTVVLNAHRHPQHPPSSTSGSSFLLCSVISPGLMALIGRIGRLWRWLQLLKAAVVLNTHRRPQHPPLSSRRPKHPPHFLQQPPAHPRCCPSQPPTHLHRPPSPSAAARTHHLQLPSTHHCYIPTEYCSPSAACGHLLTQLLPLAMSHM